jgi:hypothetical protein
MKKVILLVAAFFSVTTALQAQLKSAPQKVMELKMPKTADDSMPGTRGASVVWHPLQKKYYAVMAGNEGYPLAVFDATGKRISDEDLTASKDSRGLWYNPATKEINGNGYNETGWFKYALNKKGIPDLANTIVEGLHQPTEQSVGAFNPLRKQVMFLKGSSVALYSMNGDLADEYVQINWGRKKADGKSEEESEETPSDYNNTTVVYTGIKNAELGFLNTESKQIELYDFVSGFLTQKIKLPEDAPVESSFNFAYSNGIYWLFNIGARTWYGYR